MTGPPSGHPAADRLEEFLRGVRESGEEVRLIVRHLLARCPVCLKVARGCWERGELPAELARMAREMAEAGPRGRTVLEDRPDHGEEDCACREKISGRARRTCCARSND